MSQPERDDRTLVRLLEAIRRGDHAGFEELLGKYRSLISKTISSHMSPRLRSVMESEDVMQDVAWAVYRGMEHSKFGAVCEFEAWLSTVATNRLIDLERRHFKSFRRGKRTPRSLDETADGGNGQHLKDVLAARGPGPTSKVRHAEILDRIRHVLGTLRPQTRELLYLAFFERLSMKEVAIRQGRTVEAVRKALSRALDEAREALVKLPPRDQNGHP